MSSVAVCHTFLDADLEIPLAIGGLREITVKSEWCCPLSLSLSLSLSLCVYLSPSLPLCIWNSRGVLIIRFPGL